MGSPSRVCVILSLDFRASPSSRSFEGAVSHKSEDNLAVKGKGK